jgi:hypothetical protein
MHEQGNPTTNVANPREARRLVDRASSLLPPVRTNGDDDVDAELDELEALLDRAEVLVYAA